MHPGFEMTTRSEREIGATRGSGARRVKAAFDELSRVIVVVNRALGKRDGDAKQFAPGAHVVLQGEQPAPQEREYALA